MTYYDELAIAETASVDEIHKAYKRMTKLLHPDLHADPELQPLAEAQMKRLNEIIALLSDPARRRLYDNNVTIPNVIPLIVQAKRVRLWPLLCGLTYFAIGAGIGHIIPRASSPSRANIQPRPELTLPGEQRVQESYKSRTDSAFPRLHLSAPKLAPVDSPIPIRPKAPAFPAPAMPSTSEDSHDEAPKASLVRTEPDRIDVQVPRYAGYWLYAPAKSSKDGDPLYPPEYIEMKVAEKEGAVEGIYRARYRVADRPISPTVVFHFAGNGSGAAPVFSWIGEKGARGEIKFRPLSANLIEVSWYTTVFAGDFAFGAGTAILMRRTD